MADGPHSQSDPFFLIVEPMTNNAPRTVSAVLLGLSLALLSSCLQQDAPKPPVPDVTFGQPAGTRGDLAFSIGAMSGVGDTSANGAVTVQRLDDGSDVVALRLNIDPAPKGSFYMAWLTLPDGSKPVAIGRLVNPLQDGRHEIRIQTRKSLFGTHTRAVVSLEKTEAIQTPGMSVAEGTLKTTTR
jgi:hypothetical protein